MNKNLMEDIFMKRKNSIILYSLLLFLGLVVFISEIFLFQKPDGILGLIICIISVYLILGSIIKLCRLSERFTHTLLDPESVKFI